jgi:hypothetical protein
MLIEAIVSRLQQKLGNGATLPLRMTPGLGSLAVAQAEGEGDEASRAGARFKVQASGATGIAPVQALPTTAAQWLLYNPANSDVVAYIDEIGEWLASGTAGAGATVLAAICALANLPTTRPNASTAGCAPVNCSPRSKRASQLIVVASQTLAANPGWDPIAWMNPANTVLGQTQMINDQIKGRIILPPDSALALAVISPTGTTPLFVPHASWREYSADIE